MQCCGIEKRNFEKVNVWIIPAWSLDYSGYLIQDFTFGNETTKTIFFYFWKADRAPQIQVGCFRIPVGSHRNT